MLEIRQLSKRYPGGPQALDRVDISVPPGVFGLLGPNGAGKSTLMRILATLQEPDSGSIRFGDLDPLAHRTALRRVLGYLPQDFGLYPHAGAEELLDYLAELKGLSDRRQRRQVVRGLLQRTNLWKVRRRRLGTFSGGMRQRFGIAQALLGRPRLIIVDEPTTGLDPEERARFFNTLAQIGEEVVVLLSTHIVDDVSQLCSRVAVLHDGRILFSGRPEEALQELRGRLWGTELRPGEADEVAQRWPVIAQRRVLGRHWAHVVAAERPADRFQPLEPDLEDVYFATLAGQGQGTGQPPAQEAS